MSNQLNTRIKNYCDKIESISQGARNSGLYNVGINLRDKFDLSGNVLLEYLQEVNQEKCTPPLSEEEVIGIAQSVGKANMQSGGLSSVPGKRKKSEPAFQTEYHISANAESIDTTKILLKQISVYPHCKANAPNKTSTIGTFLEMCKTGGQSADVIKSIREIRDNMDKVGEEQYNALKEKFSDLKKSLACAVMGSDPQEKRTVDHCVPNGIYCLDFDNIKAEELETAKNEIAKIPYVGAVGISASGRGLFALIAYAGKPDLKKLLTTMQNDFTYTIDMNAADLARLRFATHDANLLIKESVCPAVLTKKKVPTSVKGGTNEKQEIIRTPRLINPAKLKEKEIDWLWPNKFPSGHINLLVGLPGIHKTFFTVYLAAIITSGQNWPDSTTCKHGSVIFFLGEDSIETTYKQRFRANGVDETKIRFIGGIDVITNGELGEDVLTLKNTEEIEKAIIMTEQETALPVRLVVIDPISNYWGKVDENCNADVRSVLMPLQRLAEKTRTAFLLVQHTGKGKREYSQQKVLGSTGIVGVCRSVWGIVRDPKNGHSYLASQKTNVCVAPTAVEFVVTQSRLEIINAAIEKTCDELEAESTRRGPQSDKLGKCKDWLSKILANGPVEKNILKEKGEEEGFPLRTLERAKTELKIKSRKKSNGKSDWFLPKQLPDKLFVESNLPPQSPHARNLADLDTAAKPLENKV